MDVTSFVFPSDEDDDELDEEEEDEDEDEPMHDDLTDSEDSDFDVVYGLDELARHEDNEDVGPQEDVDEGEPPVKKARYVTDEYTGVHDGKHVTLLKVYSHDADVTVTTADELFVPEVEKPCDNHLRFLLESEIGQTMFSYMMQAVNVIKKKLKKESDRENDELSKSTKRNTLYTSVASAAVWATAWLAAYGRRLPYRDITPPPPDAIPLPPLDDAMALQWSKVLRDTYNIVPDEDADADYVQNMTKFLYELLPIETQSVLGCGSGTNEKYRAVFDKFLTVLRETDPPFWHLLDARVFLRYRDVRFADTDENFNCPHYTTNMVYTRNGKRYEKPMWSYAMRAVADNEMNTWVTYTLEVLHGALWCQYESTKHRKMHVDDSGEEESMKRRRVNVTVQFTRTLLNSLDMGMALTELSSGKNFTALGRSTMGKFLIALLVSKSKQGEKALFWRRELSEASKTSPHLLWPNLMYLHHTHMYRKFEPFPLSLSPRLAYVAQHSKPYNIIQWPSCARHTDSVYMMDRPHEIRPEIHTTRIGDWHIAVQCIKNDTVYYIMDLLDVSHERGVLQDHPAGLAATGMTFHDCDWYNRLEYCRALQQALRRDGHELVHDPGSASVILDAATTVMSVVDCRANMQFLTFDPQQFIYIKTGTVRNGTFFEKKKDSLQAEITNASPLRRHRRTLRLFDEGAGTDVGTTEDWASWSLSTAPPHPMPPAPLGSAPVPTHPVHGPSAAEDGSRFTSSSVIVTLHAMAAADDDDDANDDAFDESVLVDMS